MMKFRVLLISDDVASLKMMQNILRHHRLLTFEEVNNGMDALGKLRDESIYHIILCDLSASRPTSIDILRASRSRSPDTKVIVITGFGDHQLVIDAIKSGAYGYLHKPFRPEEMNLVLNNLTNHFKQWEAVTNLSREISEMEEVSQQKLFQIKEMEQEIKQLQTQLNKYEPAEPTMDLNMAIARAAAERTGGHRGYNVFRELTNLNHLLEEKKITDAEYQQFRRNVLEKAYQIPMA